MSLTVTETPSIEDVDNACRLALKALDHPAMVNPHRHALISLIRQDPALAGPVYNVFCAAAAQAVAGAPEGALTELYVEDLCTDMRRAGLLPAGAEPMLETTLGHVARKVARFPHTHPNCPVVTGAEAPELAVRVGYAVARWAERDA